ncbi:MAG: hypothetical protein ABL888_12665 [Pirellulaceae bacterium]
MTTSDLVQSPPSGPWTGFFLEKHHLQKGWMHLYLQFQQSEILGEGTDYVGPWQIKGTFTDTSNCVWTKKYLGKHPVRYQGQFGETGIVGKWDISGLAWGEFHIWPAEYTEIQEMYLRQEEQEALRLHGLGLNIKPRT